MAQTRPSRGGGQKGYASRREVGGSGSVLRLIFLSRRPRKAAPTTRNSQ